MNEQLDLFANSHAPKPTRKRRASPKLKVVPTVEASPAVVQEVEPVTADLIPFPAARFASRIRELADELRGLREEDDRNDAWRAALRRIRIEMLRTGLAPEIVKAEMQEFAEAVRAEYWRPVSGQPSSRPTQNGA